jgi:hypothetical protein
MPMTQTAPSIRVGARAELRAWYLGRLRPRLVEAAKARIVGPGAVEELDLRVTELLELPERRFASTAQRGRSAAQMRKSGAWAEPIVHRIEHETDA